MALRISISSDYALLRKQCIQDLNALSCSVFEPIPIVYQNRLAIKRFPLDLALEQGFSGGFQYIDLSQLESQLIDWLGVSTIPEYRHNRFIWLIFQVLEDVEMQKSAPQVYDFYQSDSIKRFQLAVKLFEIFSDYISNRFEMVQNWSEEKEIQQDDPIAQWQSNLWKLLLKRDEKLRIYIGSKSRLIQALQDEQILDQLHAKCRTMFFYGIHFLTPKELQRVEVLSHKIDIQLYLFSTVFPENRNISLIRYLAKVGIEFYDQIFEQFNKDQIRLLDNKMERDTDLSKIQSYLLGKSRLEPQNISSDGSFSVHSCYTEIRELEALYHHLLSVFEKNQEIRPKDVLVLIPTLQDYAPFISSVFKIGDPQYHIPFSIEIRQYEDGEDPSFLLLEFINLEEHELSAEKLVQWLESSRLAKNFDIHDLQRLRYIIEKINLRRDFYGEKNDDTYISSFSYGLQRFIYGFALNDSSYSNHPEYPGDDIFPVTDFENLKDIQLVLRFWNFVQCVEKIMLERKKVQSVQDWLTFIQKHMIDSILFRKWNQGETTYDYNEREEENYFNLIHLIESGIDQVVELDDLIGFDICKLICQDLFSSVQRKTNLNPTAVHFARYQSAIGLDYKYIAVLGMDYDKLPAQEWRPAFDLMNQYQLGDLSRKDLDKLVFLSTILSAGEILYLSYIGKNVKDNSDRPPSILLHQLLPIIDRSLEKPSAENKLWVQQPLHSFSEKYNQKEYPQLLRYQVKKKELTPIGLSIQNRIAHSEPLSGIIELKEIISFYKNPFRYYFTRHFGLYLEDEYQILAEYEPFVIENKLFENQIKSEILENYERFSTDEDFLHQWVNDQKHKGNLPYLNEAYGFLSDVLTELEPFHLRYQKEKGLAERKEIMCTVDLDGYGSVKALLQVYEDNLIFYSFTKRAISKANTMAVAWIHYIFSRAAGLSCDVCILFQNFELKWESSLLSESEAKSRLGFFLELISRYKGRLFSYSSYFELTKDFKKTSEDSYNNYATKAFDLEISNEREMLRNLEESQGLGLDKIAFLLPEKWMK